MKSLQEQLKISGEAIQREVNKNMGPVVEGVAVEMLNLSIPITPVDTAHLRNSSFIVSNVGPPVKKFRLVKYWEGRFLNKGFLSSQMWVLASKMPLALVGYGATYADWVHENHTMLPKFLERARHWMLWRYEPFIEKNYGKRTSVLNPDTVAKLFPRYEEVRKPPKGYDVNGGRQ